jgi:hypothetical protein
VIIGMPARELEGEKARYITIEIQEYLDPSINAHTKYNILK